MSLSKSSKVFWLKWLFGATFLFLLALFFSENKQAGEVEKALQPIKYEPFSVRHFTLGLKPDDYDFLFSDRPLSLFSYQDAEFVIERQPVIFKAGFRIRGTHAWNWDKLKPSFRLRMRGNDRAFGRRTLDFINPDDASMLANLVADNIALQMNLLSPETVLTTVTLNNDYKGLYHLAKPLDYYTLLNLQKSDHAVLEGNVRNSALWKDPALWNIDAGKNSTFRAEKCLKGFLQVVEPPLDLARVGQIGKYIDTEVAVRWSALMCGIGSVHSNDFLGNIFVYNSRTNRLFPVIKDSTGFGVITAVGWQHEEVDVKMPIYEFLTPFLNAFFRVPELQYRRNKALYELLQAQLQPQSLKLLVDKYLKILKPLFAKEPYASALVNVPIVLFSRKIPVSPATQAQDAQRLLAFMKDRREFILESFDQLDIELVDLGQEAIVNKDKFSQYLLRVKGHCPVRLDLSAFKNHLWPDFDFDGRLDEPEPNFFEQQLLYPGLQRVEKKAPLWLMVERRWANYLLEPDWQNYVLGIEKTHEQKFLTHVIENCTNAINGKKVAVKLVDNYENEAVLANSEVLHPWRNYQQ